MKSLLLVFLILSGLATIEGSNKCYKCASRHFQFNWGYYMPLQAESLRTIDLKESKCTSDNLPQPGVICNGPCMSINVTGFYKGQPSFYGTLRDCYSHHYSTQIKFPPSSTRACTTRSINIKGNSYEAEYCYCLGDYCNGKSPVKVSPRGAPLSSNDTMHNWSSSFVSFLFLIAFYYIFT